MNMEEKELRLAVLIDADNAPRTALKEIMAECARYGTPTIKRIYGDWTMPNMESWKPLLPELAISPVQQYAYTTGKNSTDSAMIIDAMDILYAGQCDGFVLVSSDSDFTRLATRLRESGKKVYGIGEQKTPKAFIAACDKFIYVEVIRNGEDAADSSSAPAQTPAPAAPASSSKPAAKKPAAKQGLPKAVVSLIASSVEDLADEDGYADLSVLGTMLLKKQPDFDPRNYGFSKLSKLVRSIDRFQIDERRNPGNPAAQIYLKDKKK